MLIDKLQDSLNYIPDECSTCKGTGKWVELIGFHQEEEHTCNACKGSGLNPIYEATQLAIELAEATYAMMNINLDAGGDAGPAEIRYRSKVTSLLRDLYKK